MSRSTLFLSLVLLSTAMLGLFTVNHMQAAEEKASTPLLRHVVLFKFKESSTPENIKTVVDAFQMLPKQIKEIHAFEFGTNNSPEGLNDGFNHCFFVTFRSEADRDVYLKHPAHVKFVEVLKPHLEKPLVVDYWTGK